MNLKGSLFDGAWRVAYRKSDLPLFLGDTKKTSFKIIPNTLRYWCADPFLFYKDNILYIFMELYDAFKQKGVIGYRFLKNGKLSRVHICMETPYHLSYPYVFEKNDAIFMLPECYQSGKLTLYRAVSFPDRWEKCDELLTDSSVCDTDYVAFDNGEFLLTTPIHENEFIYDRLDMYIKSEDKWKPFSENPVVLDSSSARNAGKIIIHDGIWYRPAQNCETSYGKNLVFCEITQLSSHAYHERHVAEIKIDDISIIGDHSNFSGIHTYNRCMDYEVIDLFCTSVFQPIRFMALLLKKLGMRH